MTIEDIFIMIIMVFGIIIIILISIAMVAHQCDNCGETLIRLTGSRWCCPKCGNHYRINKLGLGKQEII